MIKAKYSWSDVTIEKYYRIDKVRTGSSVGDNIAIASIITGLSEKELWNMPFAESGKIISKMRFLEEFKIWDCTRVDAITLEGMELCIFKDIAKMTLGQYVDFQQYCRLPMEEGMAKLLSIFLIPKGKTYGDDYNVEQVQNAIFTCLSYDKAQGIYDFFARRSAKWLRPFLTSSNQTRSRKARLKKRMRAAIRALLNFFRGLCSLNGCRTSRK